MIGQNRTRLDENGAQIWPGTDWLARSQLETERVIANARGCGYEFRRSIYACDSVKAALRELFYNKCAYCEYSLIRADLDVDHFRPKGSVFECRDHPGYYWLAYDWQNLLPSCVLCNRRRREPARWPEKTRGRLAGKGDSFPLRHESDRAMSPEHEIEREDPLLIDPTLDDPFEHITFDPLGRAVPLTCKGEVCIEVFNLNARDLYVERARIVEEMTVLIEKRASVGSDDRTVDSKKCIAELEKKINAKSNVSAPFAGAANAVRNRPAAFGL